MKRGRKTFKAAAGEKRKDVMNGKRELSAA